jgi:hypothetical protein
MSMNEAELRALLASLTTTRDDEIGCDDALAGFPRLAEEQLAGEPVSEPMRRIVQHLGDCAECEEEYRALLAALAYEDPRG